MSKQAQGRNFETANNKFIGVDGGLNVHVDPFLLPPPYLTTASNVWNYTTGGVQALPPIQSGLYSSVVDTPVYGIYNIEATEPYTRGGLGVSWGGLLGVPARTTATGSVPALPYTIKTRPFDGNANAIPGLPTPATSHPSYSHSPALAAQQASDEMSMVVAAGTAGSSYTLYQDVIDLKTGFLLLSGNAVGSVTTAAGQYPTYDIVAAAGGTGYYAAYGASGTTTVNHTALSSAPALGSATTTVLGSARPVWQLIVFNSIPYLVYINGSRQVRLKNLITASDVQIGSTLSNNTNANLGAFANSTGLVVFYTTAAGNIAFISVTTGLVSTQQASFASGFSGDVFSLAPVLSSAGNGALFYSGDEGTGIAIKTVSFTSSYVVIPSISSVADSAGLVLCSRPFSNVGTADVSSFYCLARTGAKDTNGPANSYAQPTYFVFDASCRIVGRAYEGLAPADTGISTSRTAIQQILPLPVLLTAPNNGVIKEILLPIWRNIVEGFNQGPYTAAQINGGAAIQLGSVGPPNIIQFQPSLMVLSMPEGLGWAPSVVAGQNQVFTQGLTMLSDGRQLLEAGWHETPHWLATSGAAAAGTIPAGTYLYRAIFRWMDNAGQIHRSSPSPVLSVTQAAPWTSQNILIPGIIGTYRSFVQFAVELYRTDPGGTVFYLVNTGVGTISSNTAASVTLTDTSPTTSQATFGVAYPGYWQSTPESSPPPSFIWQVTSQGRHFGLAQVDGGYRVYYTNVWSPGVSSEWNVQGYVTVPPELGDCRSLAVLDDKILIFGTINIGVFNGLGPAQSVQNSTNGIDYNVNDPSFTPVVPIPSASGVVGTGCPATVAAGVVYQSSQGFMLMDRGLSAQFIGQAVDQLTGVYGQSQVVYGQACVLPKLYAIVFTNPSGDSLVLDYNEMKWSVWPSATVGPISGAVQRRDGTIYLAQQPVSGATLPTTFSAPGPFSSTANAGISVLYSAASPAGTMYNVTNFTYPTYQIETPWMATGETPGGEGDVWDMGILGTYYSPHILKVEVGINYQAYGILDGDTLTFPVNSAPVPSYQYRIRTPGTSRIWAVRYRVTILPPSPGNVTIKAAYANITGLILFSGAIQGLTRVGGDYSR